MLGWQLVVDNKIVLDRVDTGHNCAYNYCMDHYFGIYLELQHKREQKFINQDRDSRKIQHQYLQQKNDYFTNPPR